jgi:hypothetical protein
LGSIPFQLLVAMHLSFKQRFASQADCGGATYVVLVFCLQTAVTLDLQDSNISSPMQRRSLFLRASALFLSLSSATAIDLDVTDQGKGSLAVSESLTPKPFECSFVRME